MILLYMKKKQEMLLIQVMILLKRKNVKVGKNYKKILAKLKILKLRLVSKE